MSGDYLDDLTGDPNANDSEAKLAVLAVASKSVNEPEQYLRGEIFEQIAELPLPFADESGTLECSMRDQYPAGVKTFADAKRYVAAQVAAIDRKFGPYFRLARSLGPTGTMQQFNERLNHG